MSERTRSPQISVVITAYQQTRTLELALLALSEQDLEESWEVTIIDDGTNPPSITSVHDLVDDFPVDCRYVWQADRGNRANVARNVGIDVSRSPFVLFLDGDIVCSSNVVRLHLEAQRRQPCLAWGTRRWRTWDDDVEPLFPCEPQRLLKLLFSSPESSDGETRRRERAERSSRDAILKSEWPWRAWYSAHSSAPKIHALRFDEALRSWGGQDAEAALRVKKSDELPVVHLPGADALHIEHPDAVFNVIRSGDHAALVQYLVQVCYFLDRHEDLPEEPALLPGLDRIALDDKTNTWYVSQRDERHDPVTALKKARDWLRAEGVYRSSRLVDGS